MQPSDYDDSTFILTISIVFILFLILTQRNTNNVNKTRAFLQSTGGKTHKTMKNSKDIIVLQMFRQQRNNIRTL
jgi:hypothetical protein